jgi:hypothetical protein
MTPDNINEESGSEYLGTQSPPPPPPPRNLPVANDLLFKEDARFFLPVRLLNDNSGPSNNIGNPEEGRPESPPPPPPREQRQSSPLPEIDLNARSQGFMGFEPNGTKKGERLNTIEVLNTNSTPRLNGVSSQLSNKNELWV